MKNINRCSNVYKDAERIIDIGYFIKNIIEEKEVSVKRLCYGICSESYFSEFTRSKKSANKLTVDLFLQRLGLSEGEFENYLSAKEYKRFIARYKIIDYIEKEEIQKAENEIEKYKKTVDVKDKLHKRFVLLMKARIMQLRNEDYEKIYLVMKEAVEITVPAFEKGSIDELILGYDELFFMLDCISFREKAYNDNQSQTFYEKLIRYIEKNELDYIIKAKLYPKTVCLAAKKQLLNKEYNIVLQNCNNAMNYLQKSSKLYFIADVMKNKSLALMGIIDSYEDKEMMLEKDTRSLNTFKNMLLENEDQRIFICELFERYNLSIEPFEWYHHNHNRELYSIGEIIGRRRKMFNISQQVLSENICDVVTMSRIETGTSAPHPRITKKLFKKLGMFGELQMYVFECNSYEAYRMNREMSHLLILNEYKKAYDILEKLKEKMNMSSILNQQYFGHKETAILNNLKIISDEEAIFRYIKVLELTIPIWSIFTDARKYFTKIEIMLIYSIGSIYKKCNDYENAVQWFGIFDNYYDNFDYDISNYIITYELVMLGYGSLLGDMKKHDKSNEIIEKNIYESLKCRRGGFIGRLIYSSAWNMKEKFEDGNRKMQPHELALYNDKLEKALIMSCIMKDNVMQNFLKDKLTKINPY